MATASLVLMTTTRLSYASVMGIQKYAHLSSNQYSWLGSIYYLGYLVGEYPHNRILQQVNQVKYLAFCAVSWGTCLCCMAACHNFAGLMVRTAPTPGSQPPY